jgi:amino acid adenylation domain-containing protein
MPTDPIAESATLIDVLRLRAQARPEQTIFTFLQDGEGDERRLTVGQLDQRARAIARQLQEIAAAGDRTLLLYPPGLEYIAAFFGCLYAGVVAVPAYPPTSARLDRALPQRLRAIVQDAQPTVALTATSLLPIGAALAEQEPLFQGMRWLATDAIVDDAAADWDAPGPAATTLAFLQYTSGSTAAPKGVMLSHANLVHNLALIARAFGHSASSQGLIWLPPYHDMGLIGGILQPLYAGFPVTLMAPTAFLQRPLRWLQAIARYRATTSGGPNFAYDLCVRRITAEQRAELDLSSWQVAFNGAEPIRGETLHRFSQAFASCGFRRTAFYPCYGLAEATLIVSGGQLGAEPIVRSFQAQALEQNQAAETPPDADGSRALVGCGAPCVGQQVAIIDAETGAACEPGRIGEICVAGPSVAQGYWRQPDATAATFVSSLDIAGASPALRTGDLGFLHDGQVFITGRLKDLIIIRGRNHYPQDIELTVEQSHPALRPAAGAAFSVTTAGEERLVIVQEVERQQRQIDVEAVAHTIRQAVADQHGLQCYAIALIKVGSLPKTSSGKVQRHLCRAQFLAHTLDALGESTLALAADDAADDAALSADQLLELPADERRDALERYLAHETARLLQVSPAQLDRGQPVSALGLDSLAAIELQHSLESRLGVLVPMTALLEGATIEQLALRIAAALDQLAAPLAALDMEPQTTSAAPLSYGQQALWFMHQLAPASSVYNIVAAARITAALNLAALRLAAQRLVERHAPLRTLIVNDHGAPLQQIGPAEVAFVSEDAAHWSDQELAARLSAEAHRPFDLEREALLRLFVFTRAPREHVLLLVVHHLAADLWSLALLAQELGALYRGAQRADDPALPPLTIAYADYVRWQHAQLAGQEGERLWRFWRELRPDPDVALPTLDLPTDRPRPPIQTYRGATHRFTIGRGLTAQIKRLAQRSEATLFMTLLAAFETLLYRYTQQTDLLIGTPTTGRDRAALSDLIGYFVNPIVLRANLADDPSFIGLLERTRQTVLAALAHQAYPFPLLTQRLQPDRDPSRSPLFQAMFILQQAPLRDLAGLNAFALGHPGARIDLGGLPCESIVVEHEVALFDLTLMLAEDDDRLLGGLQYNSDLFDAARIERMAGHFERLLEQIAADPERRISQLALLTPAEQRQLAVWNDTSVPYGRDERIHQLIAAQAARTPDAVALIDGERRLSYRELDARANQLAHTLIERGVGPEVCVGVGVERSLELVVALLATLKAGGAYVPLDPAYPLERLHFILSDAQVALLITQEHLQQRFPHTLTPLLLLDRTDAATERQVAAPPERTVSALNLAYVIYTSGSTGRPKGVAITHQSAVALLTWAHSVFSPQQLAGVLAATSICFDLSIFELFAPLSCGGAVILAENVLHLPQLPAAADVSLINTVPSAMTELLRLDALPAGARTINLAGEPLTSQLVAQIYRHPTIAQVYNLYGPSEDTTYSTAAPIDRAATDAPPIGRPIANTRAYVLDATMQPAPVGVPGELFLGGAGLARGYLGRPALTASTFAPDPFSERPGQRLYKTGDLARWRLDGQLMFLGRIDHQVKLRGFRIELGEIESALNQHPDVRESIVLLREDAPGDKRLVAYMVAEEPRTNGEPRTKNQEPTENKGTTEQGNNGTSEQVNKGTETDQRSPITDPPSPLSLPPSALRAFLAQRLPDYMIPAFFIPLAAWPLTPNGKIDRRALPQPTRPERHDVQPASRTPLEQQLAAIWSDVLGVEQIGLHDNFFELGGHSLLSTQVAARVRDVCQVELPLHSLFEAPTIAGLAAIIERQPARTPSQTLLTALPRAEQSLEDLLAELEALPADETLARLTGQIDHGPNE